MKIKKNVKNLLCLTAVLLAAVIFCTVLLVAGQPPAKAAIPEKAYDENGNELYAVCISDLAELNTLEYVNYVPDEFTQQGIDKAGKKVALNGETKFAVRGTLKFLILNLDPSDSEFYEKRDALSPYLRGDNQWHFTLYLPQIFSACAVYVKTVLTSRAGKIANYDFLHFCEYNEVTYEHDNATEPIFIDLSFYTEQRAMSPALDRRATEITIHYEAEDDKLTGISGLPLIGKDEVVRSIVSRNSYFMYATTLISAVIILAFAFLCALKRNLSFAPQLIFATGVFMALISSYIFFGLVSAPYLLLAFRRVAVGLCLTAACINLPAYAGKVPLRYISSGVAVGTSALAFASPLVSASAAAVLKPLYAALAVAACAAVLAGTALSVLKGESFELKVNNVLAVALVITGVFFTKRYVNILLSPALWLCVLILAVITVIGVKGFISIERHNEYLTHNLSSEVGRQTENLKCIIEERDRLLRYLSHDMKKPISGIRRFVDEIYRNEENEENLKALDIISTKLDGVENSLSELQKYSRMNYTAEKSSVINVGEIIASVTDALGPDCEANGIIIGRTPSRVTAFAKRDTLVSVLNNLIFNAVEHADCKHITVGAVRSKGTCKITVTDDGAGLKNAQTAFLPYVSDGDESNNGLGLYICKQHMVSMNGDLTYSREGQQTVFTVTLPLA